MTSVASLPPSGAVRPPATARQRLAIAICAIAIIALSVESAVEAAVGGNKLLLVVPIGVFVGLGLAALGLVNFENFVLVTIVMRASLDITKPQACSSS
jgi:hypothetical protein